MFTIVQFLLSFLLIDKTLWLNNLKTRTAVNAKISVFAICVEVIIYLLKYNLHYFQINFLSVHFQCFIILNSGSKPTCFFLDNTANPDQV